jgi:hypothetical protein
VGAFQELFLTMLFLGSVIFFIKYEMGSVKSIITSFILFVLAIMSKETAVVIPFMIILTHFFLRLSKRTKFSFKKLVVSLIPYFAVLAIYLVFHFGYFGTISGDSYVWDFSPGRAVNTLGWYSLWSMNLPEMLNDFVGPGFHLNPNLLKYWSGEIIPIFILFALQMCIALYVFFRSKIRDSKFLILFGILWFIATISPVLFLPVHKFTYYLTLPLVGIVLLLSCLIQDSRFKILFCIFWIVTSVLSLRLTLKTNWITQGVDISERVYKYFSINKFDPNSKKIVFVDTPEDATLPWSPTTTLKTVLSGNNFFDLYFSEISSKISYGGEGEIKINSRQFLGY